MFHLEIGKTGGKPFFSQQMDALRRDIMVD